MPPTRLTALLLFLLCDLASAEEQPARSAPQNLVSNGGFEEVREVDLTTGYFNQVLKAGCEFGNDFFGLIPENFDQASGAKRLMIVEGEPGKEVHTGKRALLFSGGFYLRDTFKVKEGDVFKVNYFARGKGRLRPILMLINAEGKLFDQTYPDLAAASPDKWQEITHHLKIASPAAVRAIIRWEATGDVTIDDFMVVRE